MLGLGVYDVLITGRFMPESYHVINIVFIFEQRGMQGYLLFVFSFSFSLLIQGTLYSDLLV